ncbi:MAG: hypothetical protein WBD40_06195 [Tepidisphaeraceae bacterium]
MHDFKWIDWNLAKIDKHGLDRIDVEHVVNSAVRPYPQRVDDEKAMSKQAGKSAANARPTRSYSRMSAAELDKVAAPFEQEFVPSAPLTPQMKARQRRARRKRGRPIVGEGAEKIRITVERELLRRADALAKAENISRSQLIAQGLAMRISAA